MITTRKNRSTTGGGTVSASLWQLQKKLAGTEPGAFAVRGETSLIDTKRSGHSSVATRSGMDEAACTTSLTSPLFYAFFFALTPLGHYTPRSCFTSVRSTPYLVTSLDNLHQFLIRVITHPTWRPLAGLFSFTVASFANGNIIFDLRHFNTHIFSGTQPGRKTMTWCIPLLNFWFNAFWPALLYCANPPT